MNSAEIAEPLTPKEFAPLVRRSVPWVRRRCAAGAIKTCQVGRPYLIPPEEIARLLSPSHESGNPETIRLDRPVAGIGRGRTNKRKRKHVATSAVR